jgi:hypothetical protein
MRNIINIQPLTEVLTATFNGESHTLRTLAEAGTFIQRYGRPGELHWEHAAVSVDAADKNSKLIGHATKALRNAIQSERW